MSNSIPAALVPPGCDRDILAELLRDKRSENTRRAYARDLQDFFQAITNSPASPQLVAEFLQLERFTAISLVLKYKAEMIERGLAESTVNRRLAAIRSLVSYAGKIGRCQWSLEEIQGEKVRTYRDTRGVDRGAFKTLLQTPDRSTVKGQRDYAVLRLLWDNVLRRGEVVKLDVADFNPTERSLAILGKGRGTQKELVSLSQPTVEAITAWLKSWYGSAPDPAAPLFVALNPASRGDRLTGDGVYYLVETIAQQAGISKRLSPHRCRHSGITAALELTNGDVRRVQKLSRHARVETLLIYDDNRQGAQSAVTELLADI